MYDQALRVVERVFATTMTQINHDQAAHGARLAAEFSYRTRSLIPDLIF